MFLKKIIKKIISEYRSLTWKRRSLPDFLIVGAQKAGTTSLFYYLSQHPQIVSPYKKEVHYFDGGLNPKVDTYKKGEKWYRSNFPLKPKSKKIKTFEASPLYLFNPLAPKRIKELLPNVKIIILLRDPVERAISQYHHENKKEEWDNSPIVKAMQMEEERMKTALESKDYKSKEFIKYSYKARGKYAEQIERYFMLFPKSNILILESDQFFQKPQEVLKKILSFVEVDDQYEFKNLTPKNTGKYKAENVNDEVKNYLKNYFNESNKELYELLGKDFNW
ncbi:sulfotransferase [Aequorivita sp. Q41]|uniref:sulfotransferase family protein n=1 Tax=Aequorivita sp. Q41 TaxID=3153300 RepID=UPI003241CFFD